MAFQPENMFLIKSGDNSLEILLRLQINIERVVNEILKEISSKKEHIIYNEKEIVDHAVKLNLLGALGFDPALLKTLRKVNSLRNKFAHYRVNMPIELNHKLLEPLLDSILKSNNKFLKENYLKILETTDNKSFESEIKLKFNAFTNTILSSLTTEREQMIHLNS